MRTVLLGLMVLVGGLPSCAAAQAAQSREEFVGPFPSWRDLKRDYGAVGDGRADDTAALQRALDELTTHRRSCVLYLPAGTYRLTATVKTVRKQHTDCQGVAVVGEHPKRTILRWDGPEGGTIFQWDAWYSKITRLSFDGAGKAAIGLLYGPAFSTYNETSDLWFRGVKNGIIFGGPGAEGQAENAVLRCRFTGCEAGIQTVGWNSMDIWVWHCRFEECGRGIHNVMGNWHAWQNLFLRSRIADVSIVNLMVFSVVDNTSVGSKHFLDFSSGHTWGSPTSITGNRVLDPTGDFAVLLDNAGPYLVVDNLFRLGPTTRAVRMTWADQVLVGNVYTRAGAVEERGRFRRVGEKVVVASAIPGGLPALPETPVHRARPIIEVPAGADDGAIQAAIDRAARLNGRRPVVHLPMGDYSIERTIVVPGNCDLQLVGDSGGETGTRLTWKGAAGGVVLRIKGPSRATLRDFYVHAPDARGIVVEDADQPGGRIVADQLNTNAGSQRQPGLCALRINGLEHTNVLCRALQGSGNAGHWVEVVGGPGADHATNQVSIFTGATGSAIGQYNVRNGGRLVVRAVYHEKSTDALAGILLNDRGTLSIDATRFSYATSVAAPTIATDGFRGLLTLATCMLLPVDTKETCRVELRGDGSGTHVLALCNQFWVHLPGTTADTVWRNVARPPARGGMVCCNINTGNKEAAPQGWEYLANVGDHPDPARSKLGAGILADRGTVSDQTILRSLEPLRRARVWLGDAPAPPGVTDLRIYRVMLLGGRGATVEVRAGK